MRCHPKLRSLVQAANEIDLFEGRLEAAVRKISRRASTSFLAGGVFGAGFGSIGAIFAPEMATGLIATFGIMSGLHAASLSGLAQWQQHKNSRCSAGIAGRPGSARRRRIRSLAISGSPLVIILAVALSSDEPLLMFLILGFLVSWLLITAAGVTALTVELIIAVGRLLTPDSTATRRRNDR